MRLNNCFSPQLTVTAGAAGLEVRSGVAGNTLCVLIGQPGRKDGPILIARLGSMSCVGPARKKVVKVSLSLQGKLKVIRCWSCSFCCGSIDFEVQNIANDTFTYQFSGLQCLSFRDLPYLSDQAPRTLIIPLGLVSGRFFEAGRQERIKVSSKLVRKLILIVH